MLSSERSRLTFITGNLFNRVEGIKQHSFFEGFDWTAMEKRDIKPPMKPESVLNLKHIRKQHFARFTCFDDLDTPDDWVSPWVRSAYLSSQRYCSPSGSLLL